MTRYPVLRDSVERIISTQLNKVEQDCKEQIQLYIDCQLSYMNTNHEDFIGFAKYVFVLLVWSFIIILTYLVRKIKLKKTSALLAEPLEIKWLEKVICLFITKVWLGEPRIFGSF